MSIDDLVIDFEDRIMNMDLKRFIESETEGKIADDDMMVVEMNLEAIISHLRGELPVGGFGAAVIKNDLIDAVTRASGPNLKALPMYCRFLYNHVPKGLWDMRKEELIRSKEECNAEEETSS